MSYGKLLHTFLLHDAPVNCVKFNPIDMALATGGADRLVRYWDLEKFSLVILSTFEIKFFI